MWKKLSPDNWAPISFLGYELVVIHHETKQRQIYSHMKEWGITEAVIGLRRIADSQLWWSDATPITYSARNKDKTTGTRTCFTINTLFDWKSSWIENDCEKLPKYYLYEWTTKFTDKTIKQHLEQTWYNSSKPYLFQCHNNESISFAFECDQKADCSDVSDEVNCEYSNAECLVSPTGIEFHGIHRTMDLGLVCQKWERHFPHGHRYVHLGPEENFCRHADAEPKPWCYSLNPEVRWGHCSIPMCNQSSGNCIKTDNGVDYDGSTNRTESGLICQRWDSNYPHKHDYHSLDEQENYCRYTSDKLRPWCFTTEPSVTWEFCHLPPCGVVQCPEGYVECPSGVCIPLHKVCDGSPDCPNEEDEINCGKFACPAMFRCRGTPQCIPLHNVCDGYPDCPNGDDEILCKFDCPPECTCRGLSYKCNSLPEFGISKYARNLDLNGIKFDIANANFDPYLNLAVLNLSSCGLEVLSSNNITGTFTRLVNLLILDISYNNLTVLQPNGFKGLHNLNKLYLDGNDNLHSIMSNAFNGLGKVVSLRIVNTLLKNIGKNAFFSMISLKSLDISNNKLQTLTKGVFNGLVSLYHLNIKGNQIRISKDMFIGLTHLELLSTDFYDICCMIPFTVTGRPVNCTAQQFEVSSCENLIKYEILRLSIWIIGGCALLGNICVLIYRLLYEKREKLRSYSVFIIGLSISDMFMGVYMIIIAAIDVKFRGMYIWNDNQWREGKLCAFAGFLATVSSESSAMLICLIALDRCLAIKLPYSHFKISVKASVAFSVGCFLLSIILATIPFFPISYFGGTFYSRSSVCVAIPLTKERPQGWQYSVAIFIGLNMVLFLIVGISQILIYKDVKNTMHFASNRQKSVEIAVARSLAAVVMTDFLCWFPIGTMGVLALFGVDIPSEVYAWVIVFVLPINSALNPFLYTFSEKKRKAGTSMRSTNDSVNCHTEVLAESEITNIALDFYHRATLKHRHTNVTLEEYLKNSPLSVKNMYYICFHIIKEIIYLHQNQMIHGNLSEKGVCLVMNESEIIDVTLQFQRKKVSGASTKDVYDYGQLIKRLIRANRNCNWRPPIFHIGSTST